MATPQPNQTNATTGRGIHAQGVAVRKEVNLMENLSNDKKADIILAALDERYKALHAIRDRVQSIGVWALGILLAAGGWLIQSTALLTSLQKTLYILGILVAVSVLRFKYLGDLKRGFKGQQRVAVRLEKALGLFSPRVFDNESDPIYPPQWKNAGSTQGGGQFFRTTHLLLYVGALFLVMAILFKAHD